MFTEAETGEVRYIDKKVEGTLPLDRSLDMLVSKVNVDDLPRRALAWVESGSYLQFLACVFAPFYVDSGGDEYFSR